MSTLHIWRYNVIRTIWPTVAISIAALDWLFFRGSPLTVRIFLHKKVWIDTAFQLIQICQIGVKVGKASINLAPIEKWKKIFSLGIRNSIWYWLFLLVYIIGKKTMFIWRDFCIDFKDFYLDLFNFVKITFIMHFHEKFLNLLL